MDMAVLLPMSIKSFPALYRLAESDACPDSAPMNQARVVLDSRQAILDLLYQAKKGLIG
jgi:hypothetical protein